MDFKKPRKSQAGPSQNPSTRNSPGRQATGLNKTGFRKLSRRNVRIFFIVFLILFLPIFLYARHWWKEYRWRFIVVHHTASEIGNLEYYRRMHIDERGWSDIAYHFIINNGTMNTAMGQIEQSDLWKNRSAGHSTRVTYINYFSIAVVLVGNFERHPVPELQREALVNLLVRLSVDHRIPPERIVGHRELWATACPGRYLQMDEIRSEVTDILATLE